MDTKINQVQERMKLRLESVYEILPTDKQRALTLEDVYTHLSAKLRRSEEKVISKVTRRTIASDLYELCKHQRAARYKHKGKTQNANRLESVWLDQIDNQEWIKFTQVSFDCAVPPPESKNDKPKSESAKAWERLQDKIVKIAMKDAAARGKAGLITKGELNALTKKGEWRYFRFDTELRTLD